MIYDVAIIGSGPAGISAALNLKIHEKKFIWFGSKNLSDKITKAERISNYPGLTRVSGEEMNQAFLNQINEMGIEITELMVNSIMSFGSHYAIMAANEYYEAKTIIMATGVATTALLPNESGLIGKGVSYCATCDGELYRGKTIAVICNNARFEHEVDYLSNLADKVYYFPKYRKLGEFKDNVEIIKEGVKDIIGEKRANGILLRNGETINVDGVFILRDSIALSTLLKKLETDNGHIVVQRDMSTNLSGVYAAGDCTGRPYQYVKAAGEGNIAAHSVIEYLSKK